jgi:hypothetical protein
VREWIDLREWRSLLVDGAFEVRLGGLVGWWDLRASGTISLE